MDLGITKTILIYVASAGVFSAIDAVWLQKVAPQFYKANIGHLLAKKPNIPAAVLFYMIFLVGLVAFAILPALEKDSLARAILYGGLFGTVTYATFDLTNQAVLKDWPTKVTVIDMIWGTVLSASVSAVVFVIAKKFIV